MPETGKLEHTAIRASAGSGKTFVLSQRYIELLARGTPVERITALTFSRKAAREIFDSVIRYLCEAVRSEKGARERSAHIGRELSQEQYGAVLRGLLADLHLLRIGTIDSFIAGVLRLFPECFGIAPDFTLLDSGGEEARRVHGRVLNRILRGSASRREAFAAAFSAASAGRHEKGLGKFLERELMGCQELYRDIPDCRLWGMPVSASPQATAGLPDPEAAAAGILADAQLGVMPGRIRRRWEEFAAAAGRWRPGSRWTREMEYIFAKLTEARAEILQGDAELSLFRKAVALRGRLREHALALAGHIVHSETATAAARMGGLCSLLEHYEEEYDRYVRVAGRFSFTDAVAFVAGGSLPSSRRESGEGRLYVEYRLDAKLDHWLLDEFQDTSRRQWDVFANLADEVLQDRDGKRSFFVVGDAKQAIYGWRGGDARLLSEVIERYGEQIRDRDLAVSYRSALPVIETVNVIFGGPGIDSLPAETVAAWRKLWVDHTSAQGSVPAAGAAMIIEPQAAEGAKPAAVDRYDLAAGIIEETVGRRRGLRAAVLVRTNERVQEIGEYLRRTCPGVPVACEGPAAILDSAAVGLMVSLVRCAFHPGDRASRAHVLMSPLGTELERLDRSPGGLAVALLRQIRRSGYASFVTGWGEILGEGAALGEFEMMRLEQLRTAALRFAAGGGTEGDDFCAYVEGFRLREEGGAASVRIMTVHQSKGLDFDLVILPDLNDWGSMDRAKTGGIAAVPGAEHGRHRILRMPRRIVAAWDDGLAAAVRQNDAASALEDLSLLYVACTRARSALYMVTSFPGKAARSLTPAAFVKGAFRGHSGSDVETTTLGGRCAAVRYLHGDPDWHVRQEGAFDTRVHLSRADRDRHRVQPPADVLERTIPSAGEERVFDAQWLFDESSRRALQTGAAVHELFEKLSWTGSEDPEELVLTWGGETTFPASVREEASTHFRGSLQKEAVRTALARGEKPCELWREKAFDVVTDGAWLSGVFDRVEIWRRASGGVSQARITDFKSDRIEGRGSLEKAVARYGRQLGLYRKALAALIHVDRDRIATRLIFTRPGIVCDIIAGKQAPSLIVDGAPWQGGTGGGA